MHTTNPAPLDPSKVKAGDTVTLHVEYDDASNGKPYDITGEVTLDSYGSRWIGPVMLEGEQGYEFTLTDHQPAPEPEPEYEPRKVYEHPNGDRLWSVNSERGVQFVNEYGEKFPPGNLTFPVRALVVIDPAAVPSRYDLVAAIADESPLHLGKSAREQAVAAAERVVALLAELGIEVL